MDKTDELKEKLTGPMQIAKDDLAQLHALQDSHGDAVWAKDEGLGQQLARRIKDVEIALEDAVEMIGNGYVESVQFKKTAVSLMGRLSNVAPSNAIKTQIENLTQLKKETIVETKTEEAPKLTEAEIAQLEAERSTIAAAARARLLAESRSRGDNLDILPTRPTITVEHADRSDVPRRLSTISMEQGDPPAVALAEREVAQLEDEIRAADKAYRAEADAAKQAGITKRAALVARRDAAAAAARAAREQADFETLVETADRREESQQTYDELHQERYAVALAEVQGRVGPLYERAKAIHVKVVALREEHEGELQRLGNVSWNSVPGNWDYRLRSEYGRLCLDPAQRIAQRLRDWVEDYERRVVVEADAVMSRYHEGHDWNRKIEAVIQTLHTVCGDYFTVDGRMITARDPDRDGAAAGFSREILELLAHARQIERRAGVTKKPVIEIILERDEKREARRTDLLEELKDTTPKRPVSSQESAIGTDTIFSA